MKALSANVRGAALMVASMAGFAINDALVKTLADTMPVYQVMFLRGLFASAFLILLALQAGALWPTVAPADRKRIIWRTLSEIGATSCFLSAVFNMPLANATAILQTLPLAVTLGAAIFLREQVGWRRYSAILVGFAGVLIIFRPGIEGFNAYSVSALVAVAFIVVRDLTTRGLSTGVPSLFVALVSAIAITVGGRARVPHPGMATRRDQRSHPAGLRRRIPDWGLSVRGDDHAGR
jgi:drug/metabolite transporter (DMT)-like permease